MSGCVRVRGRGVVHGGTLAAGGRGGGLEGPGAEEGTERRAPRSLRPHRTTVSWPWHTAAKSGVRLRSSRVAAVAPSVVSQRSTSSWPASAAAKNASTPCLFAAPGLAPCATSRRASSRSPSSHATASGADPSAHGASTRVCGSATSQRTTSTWPDSIAATSGVRPSSSSAGASFTRAPRPTSRCAAASSPASHISQSCVASDALGGGGAPPGSGGARAWRIAATSSGVAPRFVSCGCSSP